MRKWISMDIETLEDHRGVTCAAFAWYDEGILKTRSFAADGEKMTAAEAGAVLDACLKSVEFGFELFTWNGLSFDLKVLGDAADRRADAARLAMGPSHVDGMFHFFCQEGFAVGLAAVCKGMKLQGKLDGMSGADAPRLWREGDRAKVLAYVAQDAAIQLRVAAEVDRRRCLEWVTKKGATRKRAMERLLSVPDALKLPLADQSWMTEPWSRDKFTGWASAASSGGEERGL